MSYALISEAWKLKDEKLKERDFKQRPAMNRIIEPFDNVDKFPSPATKLGNNQPDGLAYQYYQDFIDDYDEAYDSDDEWDDDKVIQYIERNPSCKKRVIERFGTKGIPDNVLDILLYTITGTFILFLLDIVLRVGKNLT